MESDEGDAGGDAQLEFVSAPDDNFFAHGGLMLPSNMRAATGVAMSGVPARLPGYARYRVGRRCLPGVQPRAEANTDGVLYRAVSAEVLGMLDSWQGRGFERTRVRVVVNANTIVAAQTHVVSSKFVGQLAREPWDTELLLRVYSQCDTALGSGAILLSRMRAC